MASWYFSAEEPMWVYPPINATWRDAIVKEFQIHPVTAQILLTRRFRDFEEIHHYLYAQLPDLHDPSLLSSMREAVDRICSAIARQEKILVYGDNDVDGMTGIALLTEFLQLIGGQVISFVASPGSSRQNLLIESLDEAHRHQCRLVITVDCGVTAAREVAQLVESGLDVIITDHHEVIDPLPRCTAVLNPKLEGELYPNRDLTGVGVAFKLAHAITNRLADEQSPVAQRVDLKHFLDLVAMGTISDMGALRGENRILVRYGLRQLQQTGRVGLTKLLKLSNVDPQLEEMTTFTVASKVSPRLNSLGRISDPRKGVELLLVQDPERAEQLAQELDLHNLERQRIERTMSQEVEQRFVADPLLLQRKAIVIAGHEWHPGIIAILATRISKYYNRPTVIMAIENGVAKGSIRSIQEFPLLKVLKECAPFLLNFGGHDYAAGLTIKEENIPAFTAKFLEAADASLTPSDVMNKLVLDAEVSLQDLTFELMESMSLLTPYGNENPQPLLYCCAHQAWPPKQVSRHHLRMYLEDPKHPSVILEGIAYGRAAAMGSLRRKELALQVAFTPQMSQRQGHSLHLIVRDFKESPNTPSSETTMTRASLKE